MSKADDIAACEARCEELYAGYQRDERLAAIAERQHKPADAARLRRYADAFLADYQAAVRDLHRAEAGLGA